VNATIFGVAVASALPVVLLKAYSGWPPFTLLAVSGPVYLVVCGLLLVRTKVVEQHEVDAFKGYIGRKLGRTAS
jgi:hypothetical protein